MQTTQPLRKKEDWNESWWVIGPTWVLAIVLVALKWNGWPG